MSEVNDAAKDGFEQWRREAVDHMNEMCRIAREKGVVCKMDVGPPPQLNPDGSLAGQQLTANEIVRLLEEGLE